MKKKQEIKRKIFSTLLTGGGSILLGILAGVLLLTCVYALPTEPIRRNTLRGIQNYETEGEHYQLAQGFDAVCLDGFTDSIMIGNAVHPGTGNPLRDAMRNERKSFQNRNKVESLSAAVHAETGGESVPYERYWHGYLILLKPLLFFFSLSEVRLINMTVQILVAVMTLAMAFQRGGWRLTIPLGTVILLLNPVSTALSFQLTDIYLLMLVFCFWMLKWRSYEKARGWLLFLWLGILTAFFDFLTYPPTALGVLLLTERMMTWDSPWESIKKIIGHSVAWALGYGGMWSGKWIVSSMVTGQNIVTNGMEAFSGRTSRFIGEGERLHLLNVIWYNLRLYLNPSAVLIVLCVGLLLGYLYRREHLTFRLEKGRILPFALIALYPVVWYFCLMNHSTVHPFMTHKNLTISVMAVCCAIICCMKKENKCGDLSG